LAGLAEFMLKVLLSCNGSDTLRTLNGFSKFTDYISAYCILIINIDIIAINLLKASKI